MTSMNLLREKEVIDVLSGKRIGFVSDFLIEPCAGQITAIVLPGTSSFFSFGKREDTVIPWEHIVKIGEDAILVNVPFCPEEDALVCHPKRKGRK